jgi:hypothetical protein
MTRLIGGRPSFKYRTRAKVLESGQILGEGHATACGRSAGNVKLLEPKKVRKALSER